MQCIIFDTQYLFLAEERRRMLHEIEFRDAEVARQVQTRLFKDTGTPPLPMMSNGDVPEAVGGKLYLWSCDCV